MMRKSLHSPSLSSFSFSSSAIASLLRVGDVLKKSRRFSQEDVAQFSILTRDFNPIHFDSESAQNAGFHGRIVHGMLVASLFPQIIAFHFPGALYSSQSLQFKLPVYIGDEVAAEVRASSLREYKSRYIAKFSTKCFRSGDLVVDGEAVAILPSLTMNEEQSTFETKIS